uniref:Bm10416 n=1 Tax=Brugia malayi TaxID=6279 RepID=A0A0J9XYY6_BRUMA|nr:Bm10416 [Brugia malayi]
MFGCSKRSDNGSEAGVVLSSAAVRLHSCTRVGVRVVGVLLKATPTVLGTGRDGIAWRGVATQQHRNGIVRLRVLLYEETTEDRCECVHGAAEDGWVVASAGLGWVVRATEKSEMECGLGSVGDNSSFIYLLTISLLFLSSHPCLYIFLEQFCTSPIN